MSMMRGSSGPRLVNQESVHSVSRKSDPSVASPKHQRNVSTSRRQEQKQKVVSLTTIAANRSTIVARKNLDLEKHYNDAKQYEMACKKDREGCEWLCFHCATMCGVQKRNRQIIKVFWGSIILLVDIYSDIFLFTAWWNSRLYEWAAIGLFFVLCSSVGAAKTMYHQAMRQALLVRENDPNPHTNQREVIEFQAMGAACVGFLDLGVIPFMSEACYAPEFSYNLMYRWYTYKLMEVIESVPSAALGLYVMMGATVNHSERGFDEDLTAPLIWVQLITSIYSVSNGIKNSKLYASPDRETFESLRKLDFWWGLFLQMFAVFEYLHRVITISICFHITRHTKEHNGFVAAFVIFAFFLAIGFGLLKYWSEFIELSGDMACPFCGRGNADDKRIQWNGVARNLVVGALEWLVPLWTHRSLFDVSSPWNAFHLTWCRAVLATRWLISVVILWASANAALKQTPTWQMWWGLAAGALIGSWILCLIQTFFFFNKQQIQYFSRCYVLQCSGENCKCRQPLRMSMLNDIKIIDRNIRHEPKKLPMRCSECERDIGRWDLVYYCSQAIFEKTHVDYRCPQCAIQRQEWMREVDRLVRKENAECKECKDNSRPSNMKARTNTGKTRVNGPCVMPLPLTCHVCKREDGIAPWHPYYVCNACGEDRSITCPTCVMERVKPPPVTEPSDQRPSSPSFRDLIALSASVPAGHSDNPFENRESDAASEAMAFAYSPPSQPDDYKVMEPEVECHDCHKTYQLNFEIASCQEISHGSSPPYFCNSCFARSSRNGFCSEHLPLESDDRSLSGSIYSGPPSPRPSSPPVRGASKRWNSTFVGDLGHVRVQDLTPAVMVLESILYMECKKAPSVSLVNTLIDVGLRPSRALPNPVMDIYASGAALRYGAMFLENVRVKKNMSRRDFSGIMNYICEMYVTLCPNAKKTISAVLTTGGESVLVHLRSLSRDNMSVVVFEPWKRIGDEVSIEGPYFRTFQGGDARSRVILFLSKILPFVEGVEELNVVAVHVLQKTAGMDGVPQLEPHELRNLTVPAL